ncbi:MAG: diguanylate cyclase [Peptostreptococcaceae bacterium]|nr:diguanylate cyclase [Peptostreptococcaceae bacterium]
MRQLKKNAKKTGRIVTVILVTLILGLLEYYLVLDYNNAKENNNQETIKRYEEDYEILIDGYRMNSKTYYKEIINQEEVLNIMKEANTADESRKDELRLELAELLDDTYENMTENNIRQFAFILADNTSFYRFNYPSKYGDDLTGIRETINIANSNMIDTEGFEEGRIVNGYSFVDPLFKDGKQVGCVETSISFVTVIELMDKTFDTPSLFIIKKSVVDNKVFGELISENYEQCNAFDSYYYDKECKEYIDDTGKYYSLISLLTKDLNKLEEIDELVSKGETFIFNLKADDETYSVVFLKVENVLGEQIGYLEFYNEDFAVDTLIKGIRVKTILILTLWIIVLMTIFIFSRTRDKIEKISYFDKLTGAYNRYKMYDFIEQEIERKCRYETDFSVILYDIDSFKSVNDKQGHLAGDLVLKESTEIVRRKIRGNDKLFRFGGDEFLILLPNTLLGDAKLAAENIRAMIENTENYYELKEKITLSLGVAQYKPGESSSDVVDRADEMLYKAKEEGRNRVKG